MVCESIPTPTFKLIWTLQPEVYIAGVSNLWLIFVMTQQEAGKKAFTNAVTNKFGLKTQKAVY